MDTWAATREENEQALRMRNVLRMHHWHGVCTLNPDTGMPDPTCGDCVHLISVQAGKRSVFKCVIYGVTASAVSDWRKKRGVRKVRGALTTTSKDARMAPIMSLARQLLSSPGPDTARSDRHVP